MWVRFLLSALLIAPLLSYGASIEIVEINYDPEGADKGREWVRILNTSGGPLDMTGWKFVEGGVNHTLKALGSSVVPAGGEAIIADDGAAYAAENPSALVFDSSFSLSNTGETLALADAKKVVVVSKTYVAEPKAPPPPKAKPVSSKKSTSGKSSESEASQIAAPVAAAPPKAEGWGIWPWVLGLVALVGIAGGALFLLPKEKRSGYEIISEHD